MTKTPDSVVRSYIDRHEADFLRDLADWLRIPSVSADPDRAGEVRRSAEWLAAKLRETGFPVAEVWETDGLPAVFAEWPSGDAGAPTVLVYGHHDVQPPPRRTAGTPSRSSPPWSAAGCTPAAPRTTRARSSSTPSGSAPTWPPPAGPRPPSTSSC